MEECWSIKQILLRYVKGSATKIQTVVGGLFNRVWSASDQVKFFSISAMFYFRMVGDDVRDECLIILYW
jgi:hypothetical protein